MSAPIYGEQPFWFWNGEMRPEEIRRQITEMHDHGVKGFFLHPRQGMDIPYMSEHFLDMVEVAVEAAKEKDMMLWLYDEYPYPSGVGGGELLLEPEYIAKYMLPVVFDGEGLIVHDIPWGKILYAKAIPLDGDTLVMDKAVDVTDHIGIIYLREIFQLGTGLTPYNRKRFFTGEHAKQLHWQAPAGKWRVMVFLEMEMDDFKYFGALADPLNKKAMQAYIDHTHERYRKRFGHEFGKTIKGIFTDETAPLGSDRPWSPLLPKIFRERNGYDMIPHLPKLMQKVGGDDYKFLYDYTNTVVEAFEEAYDAPIRAWCEKNNLFYTGEKPHLRFSQMRHFHIPGCDAGHVKAGANAPLFPSRYRANTKALASAAHFYGDESAMCEAYHSLGWSMTMRDMRWMADWMGVQGINFFVPHAFFYSVDALRKHDAPASAFEAMPWWKHNSLYTAHIETASELSLHGKRACRILVADPIPSAWAAGPIRSQERADTQGAISKIQQALALSHQEYYMVDRDLLETATIKNGQIVIKGEAFDALVLPGMRHLEDGTAQAVGRALENGVHVYAALTRPEINIQTGAPIAAGFHFEENCEALAAKIEADLGRDLSVATNGKENTNILATQFTLDGNGYVYAVNCSKDKIPVRMAIKASENKPVAAMDTVTKDAVSVDSAFDNGCIAWDAVFEPFGALIFKVGTQAPAKAKADAEAELSITKQYPIAYSGDNILRLGHFDAQLGSNRAVVTPMPIIDQIDLFGGEVPLKTSSQFGCVKRMSFPPLSCRFEAKFACDTAMDLRLVAEHNAIRGEHKILLNGKDVTGTRRTFNGYAQNMEAYQLKTVAGVNTLTVLLESQTDFDGVVDPLYVYGDFGVRMENELWTLGKKPEAAALARRDEAGLPFYSGTVTYDITQELAPYKGKTVLLSIPDWKHEDCTELILDGKSAGAIAWNPYAWQVAVPADLKCAQLLAYTDMLGTFEGARFDHALHDTIVIDPADQP